MSLGLKFLDLLARIGRILPGVERPKQRPSLSHRILITVVVASIYLLMANTPLYGIPHVVYTREQQTLYLLNIVTASHFGTLMHVGIGPIIVASIILQVLIGSKLIDIDLTDAENAKRFTLAQRGLSIILIIAYSFVYLHHFYPNLPLFNYLIASIQVVIATLLLLLLDEIITVGWGIGSGISLFILLGIIDRMIWEIFSPALVPSRSGVEPVGIVWYIPYALSRGAFSNLFIRPSIYPDLLGLIITIIVIIILTYLHTMRVHIPITFTRVRGFKRSVPILFLYVSNIPILFAAFFLGLLHQSLLSFCMNSKSPFASFICVVREVNGVPVVVGGLVYYISTPYGIFNVLADPFRTLVYSIIFLALCIVFGLLWVEVAQNPRMQAEALVESDLLIPGFRPNPNVMEKILARYIYPLTILSSIIVGVIAIVADVFKCLGSGTGLVLLVGIIYQYYMLLKREREIEFVEWMSKFM